MRLLAKDSEGLKQVAKIGCAIVFTKAASIYTRFRTNLLSLSPSHWNPEVKNAEEVDQDGLQICGIWRQNDASFKSLPNAPRTWPSVEERPFRAALQSDLIIAASAPGPKGRTSRAVNAAINGRSSTESLNQDGLKGDSSIKMALNLWTLAANDVSFKSFSHAPRTLPSVEERPFRAASKSDLIIAASAPGPKGRTSRAVNAAINGRSSTESLQSGRSSNLWSGGKRCEFQKFFERASHISERGRAAL